MVLLAPGAGARGRGRRAVLGSRGRAARAERAAEWPLKPLAERLGRAVVPLGGVVRLARPEGDGEHDGPSVDRLLDELYRQHGAVPMVLIGAREAAGVALRAAGHPAVSAVAVVGLRLSAGTADGAGAVEAAEPVEQLTGRQVLLVDGGADSVADPEASYRYALRAHAVAGRLCRFEVHGGSRPLNRRAADVRELVTDFAVSAVLGREATRCVCDAVAAPAPAGLRMPLAQGFKSLA
jgi:hypothetical protein